MKSSDVDNSVDLNSLLLSPSEFFGGVPACHWGFTVDSYNCFIDNSCPYPQITENKRILNNGTCCCGLNPGTLSKIIIENSN